MALSMPLASLMSDVPALRLLPFTVVAPVMVGWRLAAVLDTVGPGTVMDARLDSIVLPPLTVLRICLLSA